MNLLQRVTTQYSHVEDRIGLSGEAADGKVQHVWLTQRLLGRLVPALCKPLAAQGDARAALLNSFEQQAAQAQLVAQEPVAAPAGNAAWVATRVDLSTTTQGVRLDLFGPNGETATFALPELALRQWLSILRRLYRVAEWSDSLWPAWLDASAPADKLALH
ncbi:hypothetical protein NX773_01090 [Massilia solisilvae]|uniref:Uncharacterized protein n=1 Tax=Massilia solisilvae TaxID=1811225 RepID=A0ABT2BE11_9BURK|nr:hypothetical protein [Massilia solisilvae]MCS0606758.1 hypothetical protein [Massilia solisilvae]